MKIKKVLKKYGQNLVVYFSKEEIEAHKLMKGQTVDVDLQEVKT